MKIYNKRAFRLAQEISREAVAEGSKNNYDLDWKAAMVFLKVAYGYASIETMESIGYDYEDLKG